MRMCSWTLCAGIFSLVMGEIMYWSSISSWVMVLAAAKLQINQLTLIILYRPPPPQ
jgi:hypothetical protein